MSNVVSVPLRDPKGSIQRFYDRLSPHFRRLWGPHLHDGYYRTGDESRERAQEQLVEFLAAHAGIPRGASVLDIGCGMGATSVWLAKHLDCRPTGITLSSVQVDMARRLAAEAGVEAEFRVMDAEHLDFPRPFDAAWMVGVLGHLTDQEAFLRGAGRLVAAGGRFLLADWTVAEDVGDRDRRRWVEPVLEGMLMPQAATTSSYVRWFEESGFRVRETLDITEETRRTWDQGVRIVKTPVVIGLAARLGTDAIRLLSAVRRMRGAMRRGLIRYGVVVAERTEASATPGG